MTVLEILAAVAMGATLVVLLTGVIAMLRGGAFNRRYGNRLMRLRVALQAVALALLGLLMYLSSG